MGSFGAVIPVTGLNLGFPGTVTRIADRLTASRSIFATSTLNLAFGESAVIDPTTDTYRSVADFIAGGGTFTAALHAGVALRQVKTNLSYISLGNGSPNAYGYYSPNDMAGVLERGSILVQCRVGTPVSQGTVYVRTVLNSSFPAGVVGGYEAAADSGKTIALVGVAFRTSQLDSNGNAEITLLTRQAA